MPDSVPEILAAAIDHHNANRLTEAESLYRQVLAVRPQHADALHLLGMVALQAGRLDAAELRGAGLRRHATILPAGFADRGARFSRGAGGAGPAGAPAARRRDRVVARGQDLPAFDLWCPMLSLPLALRMTPAAIPDSPYLRADPLLAEQIGQLLGPRRGLRVGLARAGSGALAADRRRSVAPERLASLAAVPGVEFVSLQKGGPGAAFALTDVMDRMRDFADTAALIANLDLVISVDTAVAHLAGALGKPVWLLNRFDSCWRWMTDRTDSAWYPAMRIYRQPEAGDWDSVLAEAERDLAAISPK